MDLDIKIVGASVIDGTGRGGFPADVGLRGDIIAEIGDLSTAQAASTLNAAGLTLAPGFIDLHSHSDMVYPVHFARQAEMMKGRVCQGITTEIIGNCGFGPAPVSSRSRAAVQDTVGFISPQERASWDWETMDDYLSFLDQNGVVNNVGALVGHGPIRLLAMESVQGRPADPGETRAMQAAIKDSLDQGAFGLSFGLAYPPGQYAPTEEIVACCRAVAERGRMATFHQRGGTLESLLPSLEEIVTAGLQTGASVHLSHDQIVASRLGAEC
jgi:N-acyl-D-aspartate/D-glutamate deacylase